MANKNITIQSDGTVLALTADAVIDFALGTINQEQGKFELLEGGLARYIYIDVTVGVTVHLMDDNIKFNIEAGAAHFRGIPTRRIEIILPGHAATDVFIFASNDPNVEFKKDIA